MMRSSRSKGTARLARKPKRSSNSAHARRVSSLFEIFGICIGSRLVAARPTTPSPSRGGLAAQGVDQFLFHVIGGAQVKLFGGSSYS